MLQVLASYVYHCFEQDLGIHLGKAVDLHVACFKEMIRRSHGMPLPQDAIVETDNHAWHAPKTSS